MYSTYEMLEMYALQCIGNLFNWSVKIMCKKMHNAGEKYSIKI